MRLGLHIAALLVLVAQAARGQSDELLATAVHEALAKDRRVDAQQVRVQANDGTVRLLGEVNTNEERAAAGKIAKGVRGVRRVENQLTVAARVAPAPGTSPIPEIPAR
jgi:osmotically-inducible protein OsmY